MFCIKDNEVHMKNGEAFQTLSHSVPYASTFSQRIYIVCLFSALSSQLWAAPASSFPSHRVAASPWASPSLFLPHDLEAESSWLPVLLSYADLSPSYLTESFSLGFCPVILHISSLCFNPLDYLYNNLIVAIINELTLAIIYRANARCQVVC